MWFLGKLDPHSFRMINVSVQVSWITNLETSVAPLLQRQIFLTNPITILVAKTSYQIVWGNNVFTDFNSRSKWVWREIVFLKNLHDTNLNSDRVTDLRPNDNSETPFWYTFKVRCTSCWEMHRNNVNISRFVRNLLLNFQRLRCINYIALTRG